MRRGLAPWTQSLCAASAEAAKGRDRKEADAAAPEALAGDAADTSQLKCSSVLLARRGSGRARGWRCAALVQVRARRL